MRLPAGLARISESLAIGPYRLYVIGNLASNVGIWVQRVAIGWLTWELTRSAAWLGIIAFCEAGPTIVLGVLAGAVVDRADQLKLLRLTQSASLLYSAVLAVLTLASLINVWLLAVLVVLRGVVIAFNRPTRMTVVYGLVGRSLLPTVLAFNSMIFNSSRFLGPAIGGVIIASAGTGWTFVAAFALFSVFTWALRAIDQARIELPAPPPSGRSVWRDSAMGVRYILGHEGIRTQLALLVITSVFARPLTDLLPGFAAEVFDRGSSGLAWLLSFHGAGAMLGAFWMSTRGTFKGLTRITLANILVMGLALGLFAASAIFWLACLLVGAVGFTLIVQNVGNQTLIQAAVDSAVRGRVLSVYGMIVQGVPSLGTLAMGFAAEHSNLRLPVVVGALVCGGLWLWSWRLREPMAALLEGEPAVQSPGASAKSSGA